MGHDPGMASTIFTRGPGRNSAERAAIKTLQTAINKRGKSRGILHIAVDGDRGPKTITAEIAVAQKLGVSPAVGSKKAAARRQRIILSPKLRTPAERARARKLRSQPASQSSRQKAIDWALAQVGIREATGRNDGVSIRDWQRWLADNGTWLDGQPYCGIGCANAAIRHSHVNGVTQKFRWASVANIEDDARARRNGFTGWSSGPAPASPGDLVVLYGRGVHVEIITSVVSGGYETVGFNTSNGLAENQAEGDGVFYRRGPTKRPNSIVHGVAHVNYK
jgi:hypothetical protein